MATIEARVCDIPLDELSGVEDLAFETMQMDRDMVMEDFDDVYEVTNEKCLSTIVCKGMYRSFDIAAIEDGKVVVEGGVVLESALLPEVLKRADELLVYAVTVHGYEELAKNPENEMFDSMFYDGWGVGYAIASHHWLKDRMDEQVAACGRYIGRSWSPGEGNVEMSLQSKLFELIDSTEIGLERSDAGLMRPIMSVCGFRGVSSDPEIVNDGKDEAEYH